MTSRWERREIVLRTNATGQRLTAPVFHCHGRNERPLAYLQANVHGGELQGNAAILALFDLLEKEPPRGSLVLVPRVNPVGANQQIGDYVAGVYDLLSGANFNRGYIYLTGPSRATAAPYVDVDAFAAVHRDATLSEIKDGFREALKAALDAIRDSAATWGLDNRLEFALAIQDLAIEADVVLDLHTGDRAPRYLYAPEGATAATRAFGIPFVLEIPHRFAGALDEASFVPWNDLSEAFRRLGRTGRPPLRGRLHRRARLDEHLLAGAGVGGRQADRLGAPLLRRPRRRSRRPGLPDRRVPRRATTSRSPRPRAGSSTRSSAPARPSARAISSAGSSTRRAAPCSRLARPTPSSRSGPRRTASSSCSTPSPRCRRASASSR